MIRRLWHHRFGHVWVLASMVGIIPHVDFFKCSCGVTKKVEHALPHTAVA